MKAGRELDALVAREVEGWEGPFRVVEEHIGSVGSPKYPAHVGIDHGGREAYVPNFSEYITHAWHLVDRLREEGFMVFIRVRPGGVFVHVEPEGPFVDDWATYTGQADTAPLAICLASLKTKGIDV